MLAGHVDGHLCLDADFADIVLILDLGAGFQLCLGEDAKLFVQCYYVGLYQHGDGVYHGLDVGQAAALRFLHPLLGVAVAVENDPLMLGERVLDVSLAGGLEVLGSLQGVCRITERLGQSGVEDGVGRGDGVGRTDHTELEPVTGEGKGGGAVPVGGVPLKDGDGRNAGVQGVGTAGRGVVLAFDDLIDQVLQLRAQENGNDGGRGLLCAQAVLVAHVGGGLAEQVGVVVDGGDDAGEDQHKLQIIFGVIAGLEEVFTQIGAHGPVVVLAGAVDASVGLFVEQADQAVAIGDILHGLHGQLVLVYGHIGGGEDGRHLVLGGSHLVMLSGGSDAELPQFYVQVLHKGAHPFPDLAEVVVVQFLALGGGSAEQGAAGVDQVPAL